MVYKLHVITTNVKEITCYFKYLIFKSLMSLFFIFFALFITIRQKVIDTIEIVYYKRTINITFIYKWSPTLKYFHKNSVWKP